MPPLRSMRASRRAGSDEPSREGGRWAPREAEAERQLRQRYRQAPGRRDRRQSARAPPVRRSRQFAERAVCLVEQAQRQRHQRTEQQRQRRGDPAAVRKQCGEPGRVADGERSPRSTPGRAEDREQQGRAEQPLRKGAARAAGARAMRDQRAPRASRAPAPSPIRSDREAACRGSRGPAVRVRRRCRSRRRPGSAADARRSPPAPAARPGAPDGSGRTLSPRLDCRRCAGRR